MDIALTLPESHMLMFLLLRIIKGPILVAPALNARRVGLGRVFFPPSLLHLHHMHKHPSQALKDVEFSDN